MKNILLLITVIALFSNLLLAKSTEENLAKIKTMTSKIDSELLSYSKIEQFNDSLESRVSYLKDGELMKVSIASKQGHINKKVVWYFNDGKLIYSEQNWIDETNSSVVNNEKLFLYENQLVSWIKTNGQNADKESLEFKDTEFMLLEFANSLKQAVE